MLTRDRRNVTVGWWNKMQCLYHHLISLERTILIVIAKNGIEK